METMVRCSSFVKLSNSTVIWSYVPFQIAAVYVQTDMQAAALKDIFEWLNCVQ
jgi:hypothetical protein